MRRSYRAALSALLVSVACFASPSPDQVRAEQAVQIVRDSAAAAHDTAYQHLLAKYRHDSAVIDSLTRVARHDVLLRSDSIYKVYRLALRPQPLTEAEVNLLWCLQVTLGRRYGPTAADRVFDELGDTVFHDRGISDANNALSFFLSRAPQSGMLDGRNCARVSDAAPRVIDDTPIDIKPGPPLRRP